MNKVDILPQHARPHEVVLIREGRRTPLELVFEGVDHRGFGLWRIGTLLRRTDEISIIRLGFNYIRAEYERSKDA